MVKKNKQLKINNGFNKILIINLNIIYIFNIYKEKNKLYIVIIFIMIFLIFYNIYENNQKRKLRWYIHYVSYI